jgi:hypothetical protein
MVLDDPADADGQNMTDETWDQTQAQTRRSA